MNDLPVLLSSPLFQHLNEAEMRAMLACLSPVRRIFAKGEYLLTEGEPVTSFGMVLSGRVHVLQEDFWGNRNIVASIGAGGVFAESYACTPGARLTVSVEAQENTAALFLNVQRALTLCPTACDYHPVLIRNLVAMLAAKNLHMNEKLQHMGQRSTREKLLSFLSAESRRRSNAAFEIPFNRQELADYLSVDRSAMCSELGKLRLEGVLTYHKNHFELKPSSP